MKSKRIKAWRVARKDPKHLEAVRSYGCCVPGCRHGGPIHAHHIRTAANSGMGLKPLDRGNAVGLCAHHHHEYHQIGHKAFEARYGVDLASIALMLATRPPPDLL